VLYFGTMAAAALSLTLLSWSADRAPSIREPDPATVTTSWATP